MAAVVFFTGHMYSIALFWDLLSRARLFNTEGVLPGGPYESDLGLTVAPRFAMSAWRRILVRESPSTVAVQLFVWIFLYLSVITSFSSLMMIWLSFGLSLYNLSTAIITLDAALLVAVMGLAAVRVTFRHCIVVPCRHAWRGLRSRCG
jgi:hypothetical protein